MEILKQVELCRKPQVIVREGRSLPQKQTSWCLYCHQPLVFVAKIQNLEDPSTRVFAIPSSRATLNLLTPFSWYREPTMTKQLLSLFWRPALEIVNNNTTTITTATATTATTTATTTTTAAAKEKKILFCKSHFFGKGTDTSRKRLVARILTHC